jgi:glycosyltransferase involved in cell wall biosynthesis
LGKKRCLPTTKGTQLSIMTKRIAYLGSSTAVDGGSELRLLNLVRYFRSKYEVTLFLPDEGPLFQKAVREGVEVVALNYLRLRRYHGLAWWHWWQRLRHARQRLLEEIKQRQIECLHFNDFIDLPFYTLPHQAGIHALTHLRLIVTNPVIGKFYRYQVRRAGIHVIPVSQAVRDRMLGIHTRLPHTIIHDPRPDPTLFYPLDTANSQDERIRTRSHLGWSQTDLVITMVSKLLENKGHLDFLRVAAALLKGKEGYAFPFRFLMIAGHSPGREAYQKEVLALGAELPPGTLQWIPGAPNEEIPQYLRASDCFLHLPDTEDSFPGVVLEAMACGVPVIAYRVGGIPEQLDQGRAGILVPQGDWHQVAQEVLRLSVHSDERGRYTQQGWLHLHQNYREEQTYNLVDKLYKEFPPLYP